MKSAALAAALLLILSGCATQTRPPAETQPAPVQTEDPAPAVTPEAVAPLEEISPEETPPEEAEITPETENTGMEDTMRLLIGETEVPVTWEENASVEALRALRPLTIRMSMYGGFEQVGPIGRSIPREDEQITTGYGDVVLYAGDQIVIFYGSNTWAYTKLGHVDLSEQEMRELLSGGDVAVTLE